MGGLVGVLMGLFIAGGAFLIVFGVLAFVLRVACGLVGLEKPGFGKAILVILATFVVQFFLTFFLGLLGLGGSIASVVGFLVNGWVLSLLLPTDFGKACLVCLVEYLVTVALAFVTITLMGSALLGGMAIFGQ